MSRWCGWTPAHTTVAGPDTFYAAVARPQPELRVRSQGMLGIGILLFLMILELFPPHWSEAATWTLLWGIPSGLGFSFWKHKNEQHKAEDIAKV